MQHHNSNINIIVRLSGKPRVKCKITGVCLQNDVYYYIKYLKNVEDSSFCHDEGMELLLLCYEGDVRLSRFSLRGIANLAIEYREKKSSLV